MILMLTQPKQQAKKLADALTAYETQILSLFSIEPLPVRTQAVTSLLRKADIILCTSPSVVPLLPGDVPKEALTATWFAPGQGTAECIQNKWPVKVIYPKEQQNSEALMALPQLQKVTGKTAALITGVAGRRHIEMTLSKRLASVHRLELYERRPVEITLDQVKACCSPHHLWLVTSSETLLRLLSYDIGPTIHLLVTSERLAKLAKDNGYNCAIAASNKFADIAKALSLIKLDAASPISAMSVWTKPDA